MHDMTNQQRWIAALAMTDRALLEEAWQALDPKPTYRLLRPVETGMVLLRGRIGGSGEAFNLGEATITRAAAALDTGEHGFAYLLGRKPRAAELSAVFHALLQNQDRRAEVEALVVRPAEAARQAKVVADAAAAAATQVDFSTLVRGDG
jgi:alpha-D-ribose 1-methylphosphonate 5-triphosphate synthase subunit PhnG